MKLPAITSDLAHALQQLVAADMRLREAACGGKRFERASTRFDAAAEKVAREARLAGFDMSEGA